VPTNLLVKRSPSAATISWHRSTSPAGEPVLRYLVNAHGKGRELHRCVSKTQSCTVRGLVKGRRYLVVVSSLDVTGRSSAALIRFVAK
jgi:hypothetical protein